MLPAYTHTLGKRVVLVWGANPAHCLNRRPYPELTTDNFPLAVRQERGASMAISQVLKAYLDREHVHYDVLPHPEAFRAALVAQTLRTPMKEIAKVVVVKADHRFVMTVLPASWNVNLSRLRDLLLSQHVRLATEDEIKHLFPDCELGAMPPFGNLYGLHVYVDQSLTEDEEITFQAGTHSDAIRMRYWDFAALVFPVVTEFHRMPSEVW